jgi:hypothetical protein
LERIPRHDPGERIEPKRITKKFKFTNKNNSEAFEEISVI